MLGNQLAAGQALTIANDSFNGDGSTTAFTLSQAVGSVNDIEVLVDNVQQSPYDSSYSVSGTTLTFSGAPSAGTNNVYVIYNASRHITTQQVIPDNGSVTHSKFHTTALNPITLDQSNNRVGIGTSSPSKPLHVSLPTGSGATPRATAVAVIDGNDNTQLDILGGASSILGINFGDSGDNDQARITCNTTPGSEDMAFTVNADIRMKINANGQITKPNQPAFSAYQIASYTTSDTNGLTFNYTHVNRGNHFSTSTGHFTAPITGAYAFHFYQLTSSNTSAGDVRIRINNAVVDGHYGYGANINAHKQSHIHCVLQLAANDVIAITSVGTNNWNDRHGGFSGFLIG